MEQQTNEIIRINLTDLSLDEVNAILVALQELPGKICNPLSEKIRNQAQPQLPQPPQPPAEEQIKAE